MPKKVQNDRPKDGGECDGPIRKREYSSTRTKKHMKSTASNISEAGMITAFRTAHCHKLISSSRSEPADAKVDTIGHEKAHRSSTSTQQTSTRFFVKRGGTPTNARNFFLLPHRRLQKVKEQNISHPNTRTIARQIQIPDPTGKTQFGGAGRNNHEARRSNRSTGGEEKKRNNLP